MVRVAVAGASGYMGAELLRLLSVHPNITLTGVTSDRLAGEALTKAYPHLRGLSDLRFHDLDAEWLASVADVVFLALPHMESQKAVPILRARGRRAIDLSADYRLRDPNDYVTWYKAPHIDLSGLGEAVYGLAELHRKAIAQAALVATPGCYSAGAKEAPHMSSVTSSTAHSKQVVKSSVRKFRDLEVKEAVATTQRVVKRTAKKTVGTARKAVRTVKAKAKARA